MNRRFIVIIRVMGILTLMLFFYFRPVLAISNGEIDEDRHPNVGALFLELKGTNIRSPRCSGVLIDSDVFLTAGHCFFPAEYMESCNLLVTFDSQLDSINGNFIEVMEVFIDPDFDHNLGDPHDLAVVILPKGSTEGISPAKLPTVNQLDKIFRRRGLYNNNFINVGYGKVPGWKRGPLRFLPPDGYRRMSKSPFMALTKSQLFLLTNNDATGQGGICDGDSGGPNFLSEDTDLIVAIIIDGDNECRALSCSYRLDTPTARDFLSQFVSLP